MSAERFFDDLARTLAEPMPRRRAVRVIGATLVAASVSGVGPRLAKGQSGTCLKTTCSKDQRCCTRVGTAGSLETYCCPPPSWQHQCGGQSNGYRCVNVCAGKGRFPCTALIEHPESGINGVCCDRRIHSGCQRIGPGAEKAKTVDQEGNPVIVRIPSQEWKPSCCPKGPGFGFCDGVCCEPPNRCKSGRCRCPDGTASIDGRRCCKRGQHAAQCFSVDTRFVANDPEISGALVGRKCCPSAKPYCCGKTCCKDFGCCGDKCCSNETSRCASWQGRTACCPKERMTVIGFGTSGARQICCPTGTVRVPGEIACCPRSSLDCCGGFGSRLECGPGKLCVRGACVAV